MKKIISLVLSISVLLCVLASCSEKIVKMEYNEEGLLVADNVSYKYAPVGYEPTSQDEEYGLIDSALQEKLYRIGDIDPEKWLTTEYMGATTTVYYAEDIDLPDLEELEPELCYICEQEDNAYAIYTLGSADNGKVTSEKEQEVIDKIIEMLYSEDVESEMWPRGEGNETYNLKMYSEEWPAIYYNLVYVREGENNFIYDRVEKRCINVGDLLEGYFEIS